MNKNDENNINTPPTKCGYCGWLMKELSSTNLLKHKCFESFNEDNQLLHINDCNIITIIQKNQSSPINQINNQDDYNERLIAAVEARPALYNYRLPIKERTSLKRKTLWNEVLNVLGEKESNLELVQKRWKQLRDCYVKTKRKETEYIPSGSAASCSKTMKTGFTLYSQMKFLDDVVGKSSTVTSLSDKINTADNIESPPIEVPLLITPPATSSTYTGSSWASSSEASLPDEQQRKRKKSKTCDNSDVKRIILSALENESEKKPDAIDGFLLQIADRLRALPVRERAQFEIKILSQLFELEQELSFA